MADRVNIMKEELNKSLYDASKPWTAILAQVETKTGVDRLYIFIGSIAFLGLWLAFGYAGQLVCNSVGFAYPAIVSMKALESNNKDDDTKWLTYWVVFAVLSIFEFFSDIIVSHFPLYWLIKCIFLIWCMVPTELNGSIFLYNKIIRPCFLKHRTSIDNAMEKVKESATKMLESTEDKTSEKYPDIVSEKASEKSPDISSEKSPDIASEKSSVKSDENAE